MLLVLGLQSFTVSSHVLFAAHRGEDMESDEHYKLHLYWALQELSVSFNAISPILETVFATVTVWNYVDGCDSVEMNEETEEPVEWNWEPSAEEEGPAHAAEEAAKSQTKIH